jgi:hypothetical protein
VKGWRARGAVAALVVGFAASVAAGCTASAGTGGAGGSVVAAGTGGAGGASCPARPDLVAAAPACNTVVNAAPSVPFTMGTGSPPAPAGGAILDGLYEATRAEGFGSVTPSGRRLTLVILDGATRMLWAGDVLDAAATTVTTSFRANATMTASGSQIAIAADCSSTTPSPSPLPAALGYTASGNTLLLSLIGSDGSGAVTTYARRGCPP